MTRQPLGKTPNDSTNAEDDGLMVAGAEILDETGPPWEMVGSWPKRYFETLWLSYRHPFLLFRAMRRQGGWGMPLAYLVVSEVLVYLVTSLLALIPQAPPMGAAIIGWQLCGLTNLLVAILSAAIIQMVLMVSGPRQPFRATLRSTFYVVGSCLLIAGILGPRAQWFGVAAWLTLQIIAVKEVHGTSAIRSIFVVLCAIVLTCILPFAAYIVLYMLAPRVSGSV